MAQELYFNGLFRKSSTFSCKETWLHVVMATRAYLRYRLRGKQMRVPIKYTEFQHFVNLQYQILKFGIKIVQQRCLGHQ